MGQSYYQYYHYQLITLPPQIALLNDAGAFGRIMPTTTVDRIGVFNSIIPCAIACGVLIFAWVAITNPASIMVFAVLYGFFSGAGRPFIPPK